MKEIKGKTLGSFDRMKEKIGWIGVEHPEEDNYDYADEEIYEEEETYAQPSAFASSFSRRQVEENNVDISRIVTIRPESYGEAELIGEAFRDGYPVIVNLTDTVDAGRTLDFCCGLVHGLRGQIEIITPKVLLLSPASVKVQGKPATNQRPSFF
ncbi:cell division protein SepF [Gleimia sp. 6138-11-ORH1]|uniref:cell division protein SepF n=1 Tax=Gleimia sp. 6138-11-ORH1 TaxID=2973937 RepID=UPI002169CAC1|nr:cell division protein SepF [Gleimia sp. 6138-11-ORH1]MCS4484534.1 cell division protein SepF [Gleimia sp. 6138-11-ORH1]